MCVVCVLCMCLACGRYAVVVSLIFMCCVIGVCLMDLCCIHVAYVLCI